MKFGKKVKIIIKYGKGLKDKLQINAELVEVRWSENDFEIRGLMKKDIIKVTKENLDGETSTGNLK